MDKILVEVYVPSLGNSWDIFLPQDVAMYEVLDMIKRAVSDLSDGRFLADENTSICHRGDGTLLNINLTVAKLGLHNGSRLMLI